MRNHLYHKVTKKNKKMSLNNVKAMKFIIGKNNFTKLLKEKKPENYEVFFTKYYLKKDIKRLMESLEWKQ